jgi:hypothetical protein
MQAASNSYRTEHDYAPEPLARMGNTERKGWAAAVRAVDQLAGDRDMRIEIPGHVAVTPDPRCPTCNADSTELKPATVIVVTEATGRERRYTAEGFVYIDGALAVGNPHATNKDSMTAVAMHARKTWLSVREDLVLAPDKTAQKLGIAMQALREIAAIVLEADDKRRVPVAAARDALEQIAGVDL